MDRTLVCATFLSRLLPAAILSLKPLFSSFDAASSHPLLRWDALHFLHIAREGYVYEHEWAFLPGPAVMLSILPTSVLAPTIVSLVLAYDMSATMYALSLHHLRLPSLAKLATLLSLLPSSPTTLFLAPYSEPFVTYLSYKGMLCCARAQYLGAALLFTLAACFRSNGFLLSGFIIWDLVAAPVLTYKSLVWFSVLKCVPLAALPLIPFITHNLAAYTAFCSAPPPAEWCTRRVPMIYSYVQHKYWNVGFLRYWTLEQLPNMIIALPPLLAISVFSLHTLFSGKTRSLFSQASLAPHAIHGLIMCLILAFASHTQIVLRLAASMPITYWAAAWLVVEHPRWGRAWVTWSVIWGGLSTLLWAAFLPPA
ncbi:unnamed protein product [Mycena citricolor]|uniref:GPI mannosyltransferase 2 n=1 Tax=Mycena citricolor TaxID=2018698 RepID=A0AAD2HUL7_9AGAR|nr:unnamed protein product [Mycena citricolor]